MLRTIIIARLISPEDLGITAALLLSSNFAQKVTEIGARRYLIRASAGGQEGLLGVTQTVNLIQGLIAATFLFCLGRPIAALLDIPDATWAFRTIAVVPLINGFINNDLWRQHRSFKFKASILSESLNEILILVFAWPLVSYFRDYSAIVWLTLIGAINGMVLSHIFATKVYRLGFNRNHVAAIWCFGWPLIIDGLLLFLTSQGDRLIVATKYDMADLGRYSVAVFLTLTPITMLVKVNDTLMLPFLAQVQEDKSRFESRFRGCLESLTLISVTASVIFILLGYQLVTLLYGETYTDAGIYVVWLGAATSLRLVRAAPSTAMMARGDTYVLMASTLARSSALLPALIFALAGKPLVWIAASAIFGEIIAIVITSTMVGRRHQISWRFWMVPFTFLSIAILPIVLARSLVPPNSTLYAAASASFLLLGLIIVGLSVFDLFRKTVLNFIGTRCRPAYARKTVR